MPDKSSRSFDGQHTIGFRVAFHRRPVNYFVGFVKCAASLRAAFVQSLRHIGLELVNNGPTQIWHSFSHQNACSTGEFDAVHDRFHQKWAGLAAPKSTNVKSVARGKAMPQRLMRPWAVEVRDAYGWFLRNYLSGRHSGSLVFFALIIKLFCLQEL